MSARRLARELAIIVMPQLPKNMEKLGKLEITDLVDKAIHMLVDYARQNLKDAHALITASANELLSIEVEHKDNSNSVSMEQLRPVTLTSDQLRDQFSKLELAINIISEALDIPEMALSASSSRIKTLCKKCNSTSEVSIDRPHKDDVRDFVFRLIETYLDNRETVDEYIKRTRSKWRMDRMVSIDRDIVRLACTEAFYMEDIPVKVAISEAVALSHRFADEKAAKFINGILGDLSEEAEAVRRAHKRKARIAAEVHES
jgi:N utilization substance protein B